jgi:hypothetical protein
VPYQNDEQTVINSGAKRYQHKRMGLKTAIFLIMLVKTLF